MGDYLPFLNIDADINLGPSPAPTDECLSTDQYNVNWHEMVWVICLDNISSFRLHEIVGNFSSDLLIIVLLCPAEQQRAGKGTAQKFISGL